MRMTINKESPNKRLLFKELQVGQPFTSVRWVHMIDKSNVYIKIYNEDDKPAALLISTSVVHKMGSCHHCYPLRAFVHVDLHKEYHP